MTSVTSFNCFSMSDDENYSSSEIEDEPSMDEELIVKNSAYTQNIIQRIKNDLIDAQFKLQFQDRVFDPKYDWIGNKEFELESIHRMRPGDLGTQLKSNEFADQVYDESFDGFQDMDILFRFFCEKFSIIMPEYQQNLEDQDFNTLEDYVDHLISRMVVYLTNNLGEYPELFKYSNEFHERWCFLFVYLENEALKYGDKFKELFPASHLNRYIFKQHITEAIINVEKLYKQIEDFRQYFYVKKIKF